MLQNNAAIARQQNNSYPRREVDYIDPRLNTKDIEGAQPRKTLKVAGKKRANFFPELPAIENLLRKDKYIKGSSSLGEILS